MSELTLALVAVETDADGVTVVSQETLTLAREVAGTVDAVLVGSLGQPSADVLDQLGGYGVATVHVTDDERLAAFAPAGWAAAVAGVAGATGARAVLAAGTERGSTILAHAAVRLGVAMAANVTTVVSTDPVTVHRQVAGGGVLEESRLTDDVAVLTVAGHACDPVPASVPTTPAVASYSPTLTDADLVVRVVRTEPAGADESAALSSARVVVGAGRGVGSAAGFAGVLELTELLNGALGVSRVVTSLGWRPHHEQIGQTGSRVSPDLYVACGISGAIQHWAGMSSSKTIVAINTDPDAPMVTKAHYAVIGDLHEVIPAVNQEIKRRHVG